MPGRKEKNISAPRSLDVVTMTTASIPWRSCVFCHGILEGAGGGCLRGTATARLPLPTRAEPHSQLSPERPPSRSTPSQQYHQREWLPPPSPTTPPSSVRPPSPPAAPRIRWFLSAHPYMHAPSPSSSPGTFLHGEPLTSQLSLLGVM